MKTPSYEQGLQIDDNWQALKKRLDHAGIQRLNENFDLVHRIADSDDDVVKIRGVLTPAVPADSEWFEFDVDNTADPMEVVQTAGYNPKDWKYLGPMFSGKPKYRVKLVSLGYVRNLEEAKEKADNMGYRLLEGQARAPFKKKYPKPDGRGPIVFGASEWQDPYGLAFVACVDGVGGGWHSLFYWSGFGFRAGCRWAVVSK